MSTTDPNSTPSAQDEIDDDAEVETADQDAESDPALDDGSTSDWSDEGGATTEGPATEIDDDQAGR